MVTDNNRLDLVRRSSRCFADQTYRNRELIVVNDSDEIYQRQLRKVLEKIPNVRFVGLKSRKYKLARLRNIAVALSQGDVWVQWDDDDFCLPCRLEEQYRFLERRSELSGCCLSAQLHYYSNTNELYITDWHQYGSAGVREYQCIPGTLMLRKSCRWIYDDTSSPIMSCGEDSNLIKRLFLEDSTQIGVMQNFPALHCYSFHGHQTYDYEHHRQIDRYRSFNLTDLVNHYSHLKQAIEYYRFPKNIKFFYRVGHGIEASFKCYNQQE